MPSVYLLLVSTLLLIAPERATAFEADVHYGLTYWLALQAGFEPLQAQIIATGDERVDSGDMPYIDLVAMYACLHRDEISARRAGEHHYPSAGKIPGPPETRSVAPNSSAARKAALAAIEAGAGQAQFRLSQLGEGLHVLQDSWSNQGVPSVPQLGDVPSTCDSRLAWGHPETRGGPASHRADLTMYWPEDTVAMAQATYDILKQYPSISGAQRKVRNWDEIRPELDDFIKAPTKTEKARWFAAHGMDDVSFLEGISLPDGAEAFLQKLKARGKRVVLVTNSHPETLAIKDERVALTRYFDACYSSHPFDVPKENPAFWPRFAAREDFTPQRTLFVDDSLAVLECARNYGIGHLRAVRRPDTGAPPQATAGFASINGVAELL